MAQTANQRPSRQQLLFEFDLHRQARTDGPQSYRYFLYNEPHPPSAKAIAELTPIGISELRLETRHHGRVLFARTIESPVRDAALQTIVQDETGAVGRLALYNVVPSAKPNHVLPEGSLIAIKEPYSVRAESGLTIRVDHPSDLVHLSLLDFKIPQGLYVDGADTASSATEYMRQGDEARHSQANLDALQAYTCGLRHCLPGDLVTMSDLYCSRAEVNLFLRRFDEAFSDAKAAIANGYIRIGGESSLFNVKALGYAGRAAYENGHFTEAEHYFREITRLEPTHAHANDAIVRIKERIGEQSHGAFDFDAMSASVSTQHNRLDHADFLSNVKIGQTKKRGKGLFATKSIRAGELIFCEKALCVAFDSDRTSSSYTVLDHKARRSLTGTQATLMFDIVQRLQHDLCRAEDFFRLYDGGTYQRSSSELNDGAVSIDSFRIQAVIQYNAFACPSTRSGSKSAKDEAGSPTGHQSTGLWLMASYVNHACNGNAMRSFIGDMMIVRATREISRGEEITMSYRLPEAVNATTQEELQRTWAFRCDCGICSAEAASSLNDRDWRRHLIEKTEGLLLPQTMSPQNRQNKRAIAKVEELCSKLERSYNERQFADRPRLGLVRPGLWLCEAYDRASSPDKITKAALDLLRNLGFMVKVADQDIRISRPHCQLQGAAIRAAMHAARGFRLRDQGGISARMEELARSFYLTMHGDLQSFDEQHSDF